MLILGIESSCDETAAAVVRDGRELLSNVIASQVRAHSRFGGVVPEIASRKHIEAVVPVILQALEEAGVGLDDIQGIAVTRGPGLIGSLLVGISAGKALAYAKGIPIVGVNHLDGHIAAVFLTERQPAFPFVALVVSGGHTTTYVVEDFGRSRIMGQTRDDAAGEAFDKAAKLLEIGYPGGVILDRLSKEGDPGKIPFPRAMRDSLDFSFSGLKTSLLHYLKRRGEKPAGRELADIAAGYQEAIVEVLVEKTVAAAALAGIGRIVVCGGVAANSRLRDRFRLRTEAEGMELFLPPPILCTDNAAMIAVVGEHLLAAGCRDGIDMNAVSRWPADGGYGNCQTEA
jgi:N6-L-threonylcarbamoyladenine synthase